MFNLKSSKEADDKLTASREKLRQYTEGTNIRVSISHGENTRRIHVMVDRVSEANLEVLRAFIAHIEGMAESIVEEYSIQVRKDGKTVAE